MRLAVEPSATFGAHRDIEVQADSIPQLLQAVGAALSANVTHVHIYDAQLGRWVSLDEMGALAEQAAWGDVKVQVNVAEPASGAISLAPASAGPVVLPCEPAHSDNRPPTARSFWVPSSGALGARFIQDPDQGEDGQVCIGSVDPDGAAAAVGIVQGMVVRQFPLCACSQGTEKMFSHPLAQLSGVAGKAVSGMAFLGELENSYLRAHNNHAYFPLL